MSLVRVAVCCAVVAAMVGHARDARAQDKSRIMVLLDSSGSMLQTPEILDPIKPDTCSFDPCSPLPVGNTPPDPDCNGCVAWMTKFDTFCGATWWDATCANNYNTVCGCGVFETTDAIGTRGDGSAEHPGCDVDGDGLPNDSRIFQAKSALQIVLDTFGEVEFGLARFAQQVGGNTCSGPGMCPSGGGWGCVGGRCRFDAAAIGGDSGRCSIFTWADCNSSFYCDA